MAYKKYIKRNGKLYGPYIYESKRVNGKVISQYKGSGKNNSNKKKIILISISTFFILAVFLWGTLFSFQLTGQVTGQFEQYFVGEDISGKFNLILHPGELIPANTTINITTSKQKYEFKLNDLVQKDPSISNYYLKGEKINGSGEGYGFIGIKETIEPVFFKIEIYSIENESSENPIKEEPMENETSSTKENETIEEPIEKQTNETIQEPPINNSQQETEETTTENQTEQDIEQEETPDEITKEKSDSKEKESSSPITGNIISSFFSGISNFFLTMTGNVIEDETIQADISKGETFTYALPKGTQARIVPGSVQTQTTKLNDSQITIIQNENEIMITTNYSIKEKGFGEEYYTQDEKNLTLDFTKTPLNLTQEQKIKIEMIYQNKIIFEENPQIILNQTKKEKTNETIPDLAKEIFNQTNQTKLIPEDLTVNITQAEKNILENHFGTITVVTKAKTYKDKIIIDFSLMNYSKSNAYDATLNKEILNELIKRDRTLWLKDIAKRITYTKTQPKELSNLSSIEIIN